MFHTWFFERVPPAAMGAPFTWNDAEWFSPTVARRRAHEWLTELRWQLSEDSEHGRRARVEAQDMTTTYPWQGYVAGHPNAQDIIGEGIVWFEFRFVCGMEGNSRSRQQRHRLPLLRGDLLAHRADGTVVRLHPSSGSEADIVVGVLADWRVPDYGGPSPVLPVLQAVEPLAATRGQFWRGVSSSDALSMQVASEYLEVYNQEWMQRDHPRPRFYHDFVREYRDFPWWCLLANYDWGRDYYAIGVQTFCRLLVIAGRAPRVPHRAQQ